MVYANRSRFSVFSFHWAAAEPNDYVPFLAATLAMGRGVDESISSPYMSAPFELGGPDSMCPSYEPHLPGSFLIGDNLRA
jgi:hypothetical protein